MKKIITMLMLAAVMTAAMASCGQVEEQPVAPMEEESSSETVTEAESEAPEDESEAERSDPVETSAPEGSSQPEETTSEPEITLPDRTEPTVSEHEWFMQMIDPDYVFDPGYSFAELNRMGLANAYGEGMAYAVVPESGGAGHAYYNVYSTADGGETWNECEFYDEINGDNRHFALEDGGIMLFSLKSARSETYPVISYLYFDGIGIRAVELKEFLAQTVLSDGRLLSEAENVDYEITYRYDYVFRITITDSESGEVLRDDEFDLQWATAYALEDGQDDFSE